MNKDDWKKVEEALSGVWGEVEMAVDGDKIQFDRMLIGKNRLSIFTYVNGWSKGEWLGSPNEAPEQKYLHLKSMYRYSAKFRRVLKKMSKRMRKSIFPDRDPDEKVPFYSSIWSSAEQIRRQYENQFKDIKLVSINGKPQ